MATPEPESDSWTPPRIDLGPFLQQPQPQQQHQQEAKDATALRLRRACQDDGLFLIPFPPSLARSAPAALAAANALFSLPEPTKRALPFVSQQGFIRGYIPLFGESGLKGAYRELKEGFSYGFPWEDSQPTAPSNPLQGPNLWPDTSVLGPAWRAALTRFLGDLVAVSEALVRALSLALGRDEGFLPSVCEGGETISLVRAFHYLQQRGAEEGEGSKKAIGSSPHTDWGFLTLIVQDGVGGLQVQRRGQEGWVDVPAVEDCLVVNCGDFLSLLSARLLQEQEGRRLEEEALAPFHSPVHRVTLSAQERTSLVFFYYPSFDAPLPTCSMNAGTEEGEVKGERAYNTLLDEGGGKGAVKTFGEHLMRKWAGVSSS